MCEQKDNSKTDPCVLTSKLDQDLKRKGVHSFVIFFFTTWILPIDTTDHILDCVYSRKHPLPGCLSWSLWACRYLAMHQPKPEFLPQWWNWIPCSNFAKTCLPGACRWMPGRGDNGKQDVKTFISRVRTKLTSPHASLTTATGSLLRVAAMLNFLTCVLFSMALAMSFSVGIGMFWKKATKTHWQWSKYTHTPAYTVLQQWPTLTTEKQL